MQKQFDFMVNITFFDQNIVLRCEYDNFDFEGTSVKKR